jgi:hypothetical protein
VGVVSGQKKSVATTWAVAFAHLAVAEPAAAALLNLLACYGPDAIPVRRLLSNAALADVNVELAALPPVLSDPLALDDAIAAPRRFSLISPVVRGTVSVHRLVQAATVDDQTAAARAAGHAAGGALLAAALPGEPDRRTAWPTFAALLPHAIALLRPDSAGLRELAHYLAASGDYRCAQRHGRQIVDALTLASGPELPVTVARAPLSRLRRQPVPQRPGARRVRGRRSRPGSPRWRSPRSGWHPPGAG